MKKTLLLIAFVLFVTLGFAQKLTKEQNQEVESYWGKAEHSTPQFSTEKVKKDAFKLFLNMHKDELLLDIVDHRANALSGVVSNLSQNDKTMRASMLKDVSSLTSKSVSLGKSISSNQKKLAKMRNKALDNDKKAISYLESVFRKK